MFDFIIQNGATLNITVALDADAKADLKTIRETVTKNTALLMTYKEAFESLKASQEQTNKALGEIKTKFGELKGTIEQLQTVPAADQDVVAKAKAQAQELDDLVPDQVQPPAVTEPA